MLVALISTIRYFMLPQLIGEISASQLQHCLNRRHRVTKPCTRLDLVGATAPLSDRQIYRLEDNGKIFDFDKLFVGKWPLIFFNFCSVWHLIIYDFLRSNTRHDILPHLSRKLVVRFDDWYFLVGGSLVHCSVIAHKEELNISNGLRAHRLPKPFFKSRFALPNQEEAETIRTCPLYY